MSADVAGTPVPQNIVSVALGEIVAIRYGKAKPTDGDGEVPVVGSGGVYASTSKPLASENSLIVGRKGSAGVVWWPRVPCWPSDTTFYLDVVSDRVDPEYLYYYLIANPVSGKHAQTTLPSLQKRDLDVLDIPIPPLSEQRRIARILSTIQCARQRTARALVALVSLRRSLLAELFGCNDGPTVPLGEAADVKGGKRLPKGRPFADRPTPFPYIRIVDFADGSVDVAGLRYLLEADHEAIERYIIRASDVYISIAGTIGIVGTVPKEVDGAHLTENAARIVIRDHKELSHRFLYWYLASGTGQAHIQLRATKTSQPKLALMRIADIPVPMPGMNVQLQTAAILDSVQNRILAEQRVTAAIDRVFSATLGALLGPGY